MKLLSALATGAIIGTTLLASCGVSQSEKKEQLDAHMKAYQNINISKGNASSIIKSTNILLNPDTKSNSFYSGLTDSRKSALVEAKQKAESIITAEKEQAEAKAKKNKIIANARKKYEEAEAEASNLEAKVASKPVNSSNATAQDLRDIRENVGYYRQDGLTTKQIKYELDDYARYYSKGSKKAEEQLRRAGYAAAGLTYFAKSSSPDPDITKAREARREADFLKGEVARAEATGKEPRKRVRITRPNAPMSEVLAEWRNTYKHNGNNASAATLDVMNEGYDVRKIHRTTSNPNGTFKDIGIDINNFVFE